MSERAADYAAIARTARAAIRDIADFPKPGIVFKDITPLLGNAALFRGVTDAMSAPFVGQGISHVIGIESRGFIFGAPMPQALGAGFVPVRKPGKLPGRTLREDYALEYGMDALEVHDDALTATARVLVVDDVLATGGTAAATCRLVERTGARVVACTFLVELTPLGGRQRLEDRAISAFIAY